jgi:hypothetical protein
MYENVFVAFQKLNELDRKSTFEEAYASHILFTIPEINLAASSTMKK